MNQSDSQNTSISCECKVGKLSNRYEFEHIHDDVFDMWVGNGEESKSVRGITEEFNRRITRKSMRRADMELTEGRVDNTYRLLTDSDTLDAVKLRTENTLTNAGVDIDRLEDDFVSHQTMYRHLTDCLKATKDPNEPSIEKERNRTNRLQNRSEAVIKDSVARLKKNNMVGIGEFEVLVNFRVTCESCGRLHDVDTLLANEGCKCQDESYSKG